MLTILTTETSPTGSVISSKTNESVSEAAARTGEDSGKRWRLALWIVVCLEVGMFLLLVPWSPLWTRHLLLGYFPALRPFYMSYFLRGAISGLGLLNLGFGFREVWDFRRPRKAGESENKSG